MVFANVSQSRGPTLPIANLLAAALALALALAEVLSRSDSIDLFFVPVVHIYPRQTANRFLRKYRWVANKNEKPGNHLPYDSRELQKVREHVYYLKTTQEIHPKLMGCFDQVWTVLYDPPSKVFTKKGSCGSGKRTDVKVAGRQANTTTLTKFDRLQTDIEEILGIQRAQPDKPAIEGSRESSMLSPVLNWRHPRTLTTLTWSSGDMGRGYETVLNETLSEQERKQINVTLDKWIFVARPQPESHMWTGGTLVDYLEFLKGEIRAQRVRHGLDATHRALILFDKAGAHTSKVYARIRQQFSDEMNCELLCSDGSVQIPGGVDYIYVYEYK